METWYIMADGTFGDPREVTRGADGKLSHKDGRAVAYAPHGPRSRGVDPEKERAKGKKKAPEADPAEAAAAAAAAAEQERARVASRDMKAESPRRPYNTRDQKAE